MLRPLVVLLAAVMPLAAQSSLPQAASHELALPAGAAPLRYTVQLPAGFEAERPFPLLVWLGDTSPAAVAAIARGGFVVVQAAADANTRDLGALLARLRQDFRVDQVGMHLAGGGVGAAAGLRLAATHGHELQTVSLWSCEGIAADVSLARLRGRRVRLLAGAHELLVPLQRAGVEVATCVAVPEPDALATHFVGLHAERTLRGAAGEVARTLDDFHDAAAKGDEARYFAILPDDAVFLGTDGSERWTGAEFRGFAMPYFERGPAWTYVPLRRFVTVADGGRLAWFDEVLDNESYGACRGSGVLERRGERWVLRQYDLTIPVPNELARGVVDRIRAFADGRAPAVTTVVVVRHAEKQGEQGDVELSVEGVRRSVRLQQTLDALDVRAVYTSEFRRTAATAAPYCRSKGIEPQVVPARDPRALALRIRQENLGQTVVVVGHSNTVPDVLRALGVRTDIEIRDDEYDRLFVVTISVDGARLLSLRYGP